MGNPYLHIDDYINDSFLVDKMGTIYPIIISFTVALIYSILETIGQRNSFKKWLKNGMIVDPKRYSKG